MAVTKKFTVNLNVLVRPEIKAALEHEAERLEISVGQVVREILDPELTSVVKKISTEG